MRPLPRGWRGRRVAVGVALVAVAVVAGLTGLWLAGALDARSLPWGCGGRPALEQPAGKGQGQGARDQPGVHTREVHLVGRMRGVRQWEMQAATIDQPAQGVQAGRVAFERVTQGVFFREGEPYLDFQGEGGYYEPESGRLVLLGRFTVWRRQDSGRFAGRDLVWDGREETLTTDQGAILEYEGAVVRAPRLKVDMQSELAVLSGGVVARSEQWGQLEAPTLRYHLDTGELEWTGPARLQGQL